MVGRLGGILFCLVRKDCCLRTLTFYIRSCSPALSFTEIGSPDCHNLAKNSSEPLPFCPLSPPPLRVDVSALKALITLIRVIALSILFKSGKSVVLGNTGWVGQ